MQSCTSRLGLEHEVDPFWQGLTRRAYWLVGLFATLLWLNEGPLLWPQRRLAFQCIYPAGNAPCFPVLPIAVSHTLPLRATQFLETLSQCHATDFAACCGLMQGYWRLGGSCRGLVPLTAPGRMQNQQKLQNIMQHGSRSQTPLLPAKKQFKSERAALWIHTSMQTHEVPSCIHHETKQDGRNPPNFNL